MDYSSSNYHLVDKCNNKILVRKYSCFFFLFSDSLLIIHRFEHELVFKYLYLISGNNESDIRPIHI